ncbi:N-acetylneuraminate synthase [Polynucleobacter paneuropaeus]|nr:N-acetylneuraminate synthase [Polynucleobacter paneuropaeus]
MGNKTLIIAEAGVNHNGDMDIACRLIDAAADAGADIVKFQTFSAERLVTKDAQKASYQKATTSSDESQFSMLKALELSHEQHIFLKEYCDKRGIVFFSTAFDLEGLDYLMSLGFKKTKIPSGEITNLPYLRRVGSFGQQVILSTGMSNLEEIESAIVVLEKAGTPRQLITVLHCNTEYPTPFSDVNLLAMNSIQKALGVKVGYSDHTKGIEVAIAAVALGAEVIEKHITLDRKMLGPDHLASIEPHELTQMVSAIRNIEAALGGDIKTPSPSELKNRAVARKSIVAACNIAKGEIFDEKNLTIKRPGTGISPMRWDEVLGKAASHSYAVDDLIDI